MSNNIQDALRRGPAAADHITQSMALYPHVQSGSLALRKSQTPVLNRRRTMNVFNSSTLPVDAFTSAGFSDIRLTGADVIDGITLRLTIENGTGAALADWIPTWVFTILDRVDILAENGSTILESILPDHLLRAWYRLDSDRHRIVANGLTGEIGDEGFVDGAVPAVIAIGGSRTINIPLLSCMLDTHELAPFALKSPIIVRTYFRGAGAFVGPFAATQVPNGTAGLTVSAFDAVLTCHQYDNSERRALANRYAAAGLKTPSLDIRYARPGYQRSSETVTSTTAFQTIRLSSVQGLVTSMNVLIRDLTNLGTALFYVPDAVDLLDERGASVYGSPLTYDLLQATECRDQGIYRGTYKAKTPLPVPIGGEEGEASGAISGYLPMSGNHQLSIKYPAAGSFEVTIIYRVVAHARITQASVTVHSS